MIDPHLVRAVETGVTTEHLSFEYAREAAEKLAKANYGVGYTIWKRIGWVKLDDPSGYKPLP